MIVQAALLCGATAIVDSLKIINVIFIVVFAVVVVVAAFAAVRRMAMDFAAMRFTASTILLSVSMFYGFVFYFFNW